MFVRALKQKQVRAGVFVGHTPESNNSRRREGPSVIDSNGIWRTLSTSMTFIKLHPRCDDIYIYLSAELGLKREREGTRWEGFAPVTQAATIERRCCRGEQACISMDLQHAATAYGNVIWSLFILQMYRKPRFFIVHRRTSNPWLVLALLWIVNCEVWIVRARLERKLPITPTRVVIPIETWSLFNSPLRVKSESRRSVCISPPTPPLLF